MMPQTLTSSPELEAAVDRLISGDVFTAFAVEGREQRAAGLEAVLRAVVDTSTRVVWVGNPLRSPLTIERFLLQIAGPEVDLRIERGPAELASLIARREGGETRLLVIVQQPETINPETIEQLEAMAGHLGNEAVQLQFLFVGSPALRLPKVAVADLGPINSLEIPVAESRPVALTVIAFEAGDWTIGAVPRRYNLLPWLVGLLGLFLATVFFFAPPAGKASKPTLGTTAPHLPTVSLGENDLLRQRFDGFLGERAASLPPLSEAQKRVLFNEFRTRSGGD